MNLELLIIKLFLVDTPTYIKYNKYVGKKFNNIYTKLHHTLSKLKDDGKSSHTVEELALKFHVCYPVLSEGESNALTDILSALSQVTVEPGQADELLTQLRQRAIAADIALKAVEVASGDGDLGSLQSAIEELQQEDSLDESEEQFVSDDLVLLQERLAAEPPFKFRLKTLNQILGGLRRRTFGFLFARPEKGKTQLLASEGTFLAPQTTNGILWVNNEEDGSALITRCYQAALERDSEYLFKNAELARNEYVQKISGRIKIYDRPTARARDIEAVVRSIRPDIIFIDQLDKVHGFDAERYDLLQKAKYQWARELAKRYNCAVIGICQAGGSAENKRYLDMNDVDSSHTAKQGEADWMVGMGGTDKVGDEDRRYLSFTKNKLPPTPDMIQGMRHAKVPIKSVPEIQIYEDILNLDRD
ncbi:MAG TPA: AAA family ATPase [Chitinophagaceae bacterium]